MSLHEGGTNTGAIEWDSFSKAWREPGRKRQASGSVALLQSASMLLCCTPETCSLYVPKGSCCEVTCLPSLALPQSGEQMSDGRAQAAC